MENMWFMSSGIGPTSIGVVSGSEFGDVGCDSLFFFVMARIVENNWPISSALGVVKIGFVLVVSVDVDADFLFFLVMIGRCWSGFDCCGFTVIWRIFVLGTKFGFGTGFPLPTAAIYCWYFVMTVT